MSINVLYIKKKICGVCIVRRYKFQLIKSEPFLSIHGNYLKISSEIVHDVYRKSLIKLQINRNGLSYPPFEPNSSLFCMQHFKLYNYGLKNDSIFQKQK